MVSAKKNREWNSPDLLNEWRENWAHHQNRALERHGYQSRVDHRSYEAQGIDREPTQHLGPVAADMERNGNPSRIGDENRDIANDNQQRAKDHAEAARLASEIAREKWKFGQWAEYKRSEIQHAQELADLDLSQKHHRQSLNLEKQLEQIYGPAKATITAEIAAIDRRLEAAGIRKVLRDVFGRTQSDTQVRESMQASLEDIHDRENEQRQMLAVRQSEDLTKEASRQARNRDRLERGIKTARNRREATDWKSRPVDQKTRETRSTGKWWEKSRGSEDTSPAPESIHEREQSEREEKSRLGRIERPWYDSAARPLSSLDADPEQEREDERGEEREGGRSRGRGPTPEGGS